MGRKPILGRTFLTEEGQFDGPKVAVLGYGIWQRHFAGKRDAIGQTLSMNDQIYTVVGVMPADLEFPGRTEVWTPLTLNSKDWQERGGHYLGGVGRLQRGVTLAGAQADLNVISARAQQQFPVSNLGWDTTLRTLQEQTVGKVRPLMITLTVAVGFVLLIACVNLANLLLSRSSTRRREIGIRSSLGAGRWRLVRQLLTESILLALVGAALGLLLAKIGAGLLVNLSPNVLPRAKEIAVDLRALAFTGAIAILTALLFGLAPAMQMANFDLVTSLRETGRGNAIGFRQNRLRSALMVSEVALALVLLSGAGLLMRSFYRLESVDPGFDPHGILTFRTNLPGAKYHSAELVAAFYRRALDQIRALPGVSAAGAAQIFPLSGSYYNLSFRQVGKPPVEPAVAIISEAMAQQFYRNENPLGQRIQIDSGSKPAEIVGIVGNVRDEQMETVGSPTMYRPAAQDPFESMYFGVRTTGDPEAAIAGVRAVIRGLDPELPLDAVGTVDGLVWSSLSQRRFAMLLMAVFAALALILAMVGLYGVISYSVTQATQEIGIRMALGAGRAQVLRLVFGYSGGLLAAGLALGLGAAVLAGRLLARQLFEIKAADPVTLAGVAVALLVTGLAASLVPAWRAMRVDPLVALRNE